MQKTCMLLFLITIRIKESKRCISRIKEEPQNTCEEIILSSINALQHLTVVYILHVIGEPLTHIFDMLSILFRPFDTIKTTFELHTI